MPSKNDFKFGELAAQHNYTTPSRVTECLLIQTQMEKQGRTTSLDRILHEKGYMTEEAIETIQEKMGRKILFCTECGAKLNVAGIEIGAAIRCTKCNARLTVPASVLPARAKRIEAAPEAPVPPPEEEPAIEEGAKTDEVGVDESAGNESASESDEEPEKDEAAKAESESDDKPKTPKGRFSRFGKYRK